VEDKYMERNRNRSPKFFSRGIMEKYVHFKRNRTSPTRNGWKLVLMEIRLREKRRYFDVIKLESKRCINELNQNKIDKNI
jgi:hypothetical protein